MRAPSSHIPPAPAQQTGLSKPVLFGLALILIVLWGTAYNLVTVGVRYMPPIWLVAWRSIVGMILITAYAFWRGYRFPPLKEPRWLWYVGLSLTGMVIPFFLLGKAQITVHSGVSSILVGVMPIITIILAHFFVDERLSWRKLIGFTIGFCGIIILFLPKDFSFDLVKDWKAQLLIVAAAFFYALTTVAAKRAPETPASLGAAMMVTGAAVSSLIIALLTSPPPEITPGGAQAVLALGIGSTGIGTILYLYVINKAGPSSLAKINYFPPVAAVIVADLFLDEPFTYQMGAAFIVILIGVIISQTEKASSEAP